MPESYAMISRLFAAFCIFILSALSFGQTPTNGPKADTSSSADATKAETANEPLASAQELWNRGKYEDAAAAFQSIVAKNPASAQAQAGLIRSLLRSRKLDEADEAAQKAVAAVPGSALVHAAAGDVDFREGKFGEAEGEYRASLKIDASLARGVFGLARMMQMVSMKKSANATFAKAHQLDPNDSQIFEYWLESLPRAQQLDAIKKRAGDHPNENEANRIKYATEVAQKKPWVLAGPIKPIEIRMEPYGKEMAGTYDISRNGAVPVAKGFALQVRFNDRAGASLLLDTGASGITIGRKLAEKAGVVKIADSYFGGIGDKGPVEGYVGWVDKIKIGDVEFHDCIVEVSSKNNIIDQSGLIGADVFRQFLVTLDFKERKLLLAPLPKGPNASDDEIAQDRYVAPEMQNFTKVYLLSKDLIVPVVVSDKTMANFILDTGADLNNISPRLAAQVTKASAQGDYVMKGVSGSVEQVQTGNKAILQFAKMRIESHDLPVFSMDNISGSEGTEIAGLIGIRTLSQMKMTIDYRDGLVNLEVYDFKKARE